MVWMQCAPEMQHGKCSPIFRRFDRLDAGSSTLCWPSGCSRRRDVLASTGARGVARESLATGVPVKGIKSPLYTGSVC